MIIMITDSLNMTGILYSVLSLNKNESQNIFILNIVILGVIKLKNLVFQ